METKASYVQARRFFDFHTLILNSYIKLIIRNTQFLFCHKLSFGKKPFVLLRHIVFFFSYFLFYPAHSAA